MKPAPTMIDAVYRASFSNRTNAGWRNNADMRHVIERARRFIIGDDRTAAFMAELANVPFLKPGPILVKIADSLRVQSRLPHETIWIEYPLRPYHVRSSGLRGAENNPEEQPTREGWLIQQHPKIETACIMHLFTQHAVTQEDGYDLWTFPFAFAWCCDENPLPWQTVFRVEPGGMPASVWLAGLRNYERENVNCVRSPLIVDPVKSQETEYRYLLQEWTGSLRRVWALLATIDNLPLTYGQVRQSKGFLGRGRIRKFLDHTTITLNIPAKVDTRVLARKVIAIAHRKRHSVRSHWRDDWRNVPSKRCNPHLWECVDDNADLIRCETCRGQQMFIHQHERGDASLGYVTHDYKVTHGKVD